MRESSVSIVATLWLLSLIFGVPPVLAISVGLPSMALAVHVYVCELRYRRGRRR